MTYSFVYLIFQLFTAFCYFCIPLLKQKSMTGQSIMGVPWLAYAAFILFCGLHHLGCVTMAIDMPHHLALMYQGTLGAVRMAVDFLMSVFSGVAAYLTIKEAVT